MGITEVSPTLFPDPGRELRKVIYSHGNLFYTQSFPAEADQDACPPGFQSRPRITRLHQARGLVVEAFLEEKDHLGMVDDYMLRVNRGMKVGLRA